MADGHWVMDAIRSLGEPLARVIFKLKATPCTFQEFLYFGRSGTKIKHTFDLNSFYLKIHCATPCTCNISSKGSNMIYSIGVLTLMSNNIRAIKVNFSPKVKHVLV